MLGSDKENIKLLQGALDKIDKEILDLNAKKQFWLGQVNKAGYTIDNGKVVKNSASWVIHWKLNYYSRYVGEKGPLYDERQGARPITIAQYNEIMQGYQDEDATPLAKILEEYVEDYFTDRIPEAGELEYEEDGSFFWSSETDDIGDLINSRIYIERMDVKKMKSIEDVSEDDVFQ